MIFGRTQCSIIGSNQNFIENGYRVLVSNAFRAAIPMKNQLAMVHAEKVEYGGIKIVNADRIDDGFVPDIVSSAVNRAPLDASAGHPRGKARWIVISASCRARRLGDREASEFPAPNHQGAVEQPSLLEVSQERTDRFICLLAAIGQAFP